MYLILPCYSRSRNKDKADRATKAQVGGCSSNHKHTQIGGWAGFFYTQNTLRVRLVLYLYYYVLLGVKCR